MHNVSGDHIDDELQQAFQRLSTHWCALDVCCCCAAFATSPSAHIPCNVSLLAFIGLEEAEYLPGSYDLASVPPSEAMEHLAEVHIVSKRLAVPGAGVLTNILVDVVDLSVLLLTCLCSVQPMSLLTYALHLALVRVLPLACEHHMTVGLVGTNVDLRVQLSLVRSDISPYAFCTGALDLLLPYFTFKDVLAILRYVFGRFLKAHFPSCC